VDVDGSVRDLPGAVHLGWHIVVRDHVLGGIVGRHGGDGEPINATDQAHDRTVGNAEPPGLAGDRLHQFGVPDVDHEHAFPPIMGLRR